MSEHTDQNIIDVHSLEKATDVQFETDKQNYENGVRSTLIGKHFKNEDAKKEKSRRDAERDSLSDVGKFYSSGQSIENSLKTILGNFLKGLSVGFKYDQHDKDLYVTTSEEYLATGNDEAQYAESKIEHNLGNAHSENVSRDPNQGSTNDFSKSVNPEKIDTGKKAVAVTDSFGKTNEIAAKRNSYKKAMTPKNDNVFLVSDKKIPLYQKQDGSFSLEKSDGAKIVVHSTRFPGSNKYVVEVPKDVAEIVAKKNKEEVTGIMICNDLEKICPGSVKNNASTIEEYQKKKKDNSKNVTVKNKAVNNLSSSAKKSGRHM